jgi:hypothetical protein
MQVSLHRNRTNRPYHRVAVLESPYLTVKAQDPFVRSNFASK